MRDVYRPLTLNLCIGCSIIGFITSLVRFCKWLSSGEEYGACRDEFLTEETFPFEMT